MGSERPLLIVNPATGKLGGASALRRFVAAVEGALGDVDIEATERRGHAIDLAREGALGGRSAIVAVGGDGTLNEVVNGVMQARARPAAPAPSGPVAHASASYGTAAAGPAVPGHAVVASPRVGLIGLGTGGDFGASLGIGGGLDAYLAALTSGRTRSVDLVRATFADHEGGSVERYFINVLSVGPGGLVDTYVARFPRAFGGRLAYAGASLLALVECPRARLRLRMAPAGRTVGDARDAGKAGGTGKATSGGDGAASGAVEERDLSAYLVAVCNGVAFGGGMRMAPMAAPDDGLLDVIVIAVRSKWTVARNIPKVYGGHHLTVPGVEHLRCRSLELELRDEQAAERFALDVDGEALGRLPLRVEVVPGALEMFVP